jgi:hypothetical protein
VRNPLRNAAVLIALNIIGGMFLLGLAQEESVPGRHESSRTQKFARFEVRPLQQESAYVQAAPSQPQELAIPLQQEQSAPQPEKNAKVPMCRNIQLAATYLPQSAQGGSPSFQFVVHNGTDEAVFLEMPAPTSAHWYALEGARWSWRASNGSGGSPVDAMNLRGPVFAFRANYPADHRPRKLFVAAHGSLSWEVKPADNPVVTFHPSCPHCNHPTDRQFRVVFAYAVLPGDDDKRVLSCGLRTEPVAVPVSYARYSVDQAAQSRLSLQVVNAALEKAEASPENEPGISGPTFPATRSEP